MIVQTFKRLSKSIQVRRSTKPKVEEPKNFNRKYKIVVISIMLIIILGSVLSSLIPPAEMSYQGNERILSFISEIKIKGEQLVVNESIKVQAEGRAFKAGLNRSLPKTNATNQPTNFNALTAFIDSKTITPTSDSKQSNFYFHLNSEGDLPAGTHNFDLVYEANGIFSVVENEKLFIWPVTGLNWAVPVDQSFVRITLPHEVNPDKVKLKAYQYSRTTRRLDPEAVDAKFTTHKDNFAIEIKSRKVFPPNTGLVVEMRIGK